MKSRFSPTKRSVRQRSILCLEPLERRDAPATLVSATRLTYQDSDGDNVTVTLSKPILTAINANIVFHFDAGSVDGSNALPQRLERINLGLAVVPAEVAGVNITTTATRSPATGGDGLATLGHILATGIDLGAVTIDGDLGRVVAGDAVTATAGLKGLTAQSLGSYGTFTGAPDLHTQIQGRLDFLRSKSDVQGEFVDVQGGVDGDIGPVNIGGSLLGGVTVNSGRISASGDIGPVTIRGDVVGGGGAATGSGAIFCNGKLAGLTMGGSLHGGAGSSSGQIRSLAGMGAVRITGDLIGGDGDNSALIGAGSALAGVTIGGSLRGGLGRGSGVIGAFGAVGPVKITGDMVGVGQDSGAIFSGDKLAGVTVGGSLLGGLGTSSGRITSIGSMGPVRITGNVIGGAGSDSGSIHTDGVLAGMRIGGTLAGSGASSGRISSGGAMGAVRIAGDLFGAGENSAMIDAGDKLAGVTIGGAVRGGSSPSAGSINSVGAIGLVKIAGDVIGGSAIKAGSISAGGIARLTIGGSLRGGTGQGTGGVFSLTGPLGMATITGDIVGGTAHGAADLQSAGCILAQRLASLAIGGSLIAGTDDTTGSFLNNGAVRVLDDLGTVLIRGSVIGNASNPAIISARGSATPTATTDLALTSLTILGRVEHALVQAGVNIFGLGKNADAQIGAVTVGGNWIASSVVAGASSGVDHLFGNADDAVIDGVGVTDTAGIKSRIASVAIGGAALGTVGGADHFGIVAQQVSAVKIGGTPLVLSVASGSDDLFVGITGDFNVNEV
jgi:hypothetical protein